MSEIDNQQRHELYLAKKLASADLADIASLRALPATDRYLLRRARDIRDGHAAAVLNDGSLRPEEREIRRRLYQAFDEFSRVLDADEAVHRIALQS